MGSGYGAEEDIPVRDGWGRGGGYFCFEAKSGSGVMLEERGRRG